MKTSPEMQEALALAEHALRCAVHAVDNALREIGDDTRAADHPQLAVAVMEAYRMALLAMRLDDGA